MAKHIWDLANVKENRIKDKSIWQMTTSSNFPWWWKKLMKIKDEMHYNVKHKIGNERYISLWFNYWHLLGPFIDKFCVRIIFDFVLFSSAKVSELIMNKDWRWLYVNSPSLLEAKNALIEKSLVDLSSDVKVSELIVNFLLLTINLSFILTQEVYILNDIKVKHVKYNQVSCHFFVFQSHYLAQHHLVTYDLIPI